jgi:hypothetical protein
VAAKEKLIRDRVPQIIRAQGDEPFVRIADPGEYRELLRAKLVEEATRSPRQTMHTFPRNWPMFLKSCWRSPPISVSMLADSRGCARPRPLNGAASPSESSGAATSALDRSWPCRRRKSSRRIGGRLLTRCR